MPPLVPSSSSPKHLEYNAMHSVRPPLAFTTKKTYRHCDTRALEPYRYVFRYPSFLSFHIPSAQIVYLLTHSLFPPDQDMSFLLSECELNSNISRSYSLLVFCANYVLTPPWRHFSPLKPKCITMMIGMLPMIYSFAVAFLTDHRNTEHGLFRSDLKLHRY